MSSIEQTYDDMMITIEAVKAFVYVGVFVLAQAVYFIGYLVIEWASSHE